MFVERHTGVITPTVLVDETATMEISATATDLGVFSVDMLLTVDATSSQSATQVMSTTSDASVAVAAAFEDAFLQDVPTYTSGITVTQDGTTTTIYNITFGGDASGYDIVSTTSGDTNFENGSAATDAVVVVGSSTGTDSIPIRRYAEVKRIYLPDMNDTSVDIVIKDQGDITNGRTVFSSTAIDVSSAVDKLLGYDGVAGEDGAAAANTLNGLFRGPLAVSVVTSSPAVTTDVVLFVKDNSPSKVNRYKRVSTNTQVGTATTTGDTRTLHLGTPGQCAEIKRLRFTSTDTGVTPTITDANGFVVYTKSSTDYSTAVDEVVGHEGLDQSGNAVADTLPIVAKSPLTLDVSNSVAAGETYRLDVWLES